MGGVLCRAIARCLGIILVGRGTKPDLISPHTTKRDVIGGHISNHELCIGPRTPNEPLITINYLPPARNIENNIGEKIIKEFVTVIVKMTNHDQ